MLACLQTADHSLVLVCCRSLTAAFRCHQETTERKIMNIRPKRKDSEEEDVIIC